MTRAQMDAAIHAVMERLGLDHTEAQNQETVRAVLRAADGIGLLVTTLSTRVDASLVDAACRRLHVAARLGTLAESENPTWRFVVRSAFNVNRAADRALHFAEQGDATVNPVLVDADRALLLGHLGVKVA